MFKRFAKSTGGFSLMELIVAVGIMSVLLAMLSPALLNYIEDSRLQRDESAMAEVVNVVKQSLDSDTDVYDEIYRIAMYTNEEAVYIAMKEANPGEGLSPFILNQPLEDVAPRMERKIHGVMVKPYKTTSAACFDMQYQIAIHIDEDGELRTVKGIWTETATVNTVSGAIVNPQDDEVNINHPGKPD